MLHRKAMLPALLLVIPSLAATAQAPLPCRPMTTASAGPSSVMIDHWKVRTDVGEPMPTAPTMVMLYTSGGHHETVTYSLIVARRADGGWRWTAVGQRSYWIGEEKSTPMPRAE